MTVLPSMSAGDKLRREPGLTQPGVWAVQGHGLPHLITEAFGAFFILLLSLLKRRRDGYTSAS